MKERIGWLGLLPGVLLLLPLRGLAADSACQTMVEMRGQVEVRKEGKGWELAAKGMALNEKDEIRTAGGGLAEILLDEGDESRGTLELREKSHLRLTELSRNSQTGDKATLLELALGSVLVHAEKLKGNSKFEVRTPTSTTGVRGTTFEVSVEEK